MQMNQVFFPKHQGREDKKELSPGAAARGEVHMNKTDVAPKE
jgi:hypothetical protein